MTLSTPHGPFTVAVLDEQGASLPGSVVAGQESPPRGWLSRYYAERVPVPSLVVERSVEVPTTTVSVLAAGAPEVRVESGRWSVQAAGISCDFHLEGGKLAVDPR
jgi:asparagine synthase (glutamine-hydrolysing)